MSQTLDQETRPNVRWQLFAMMVLEFFIWGAWFPLIFGYLPSLGFSAGEQSWILNTFPIAAIWPTLMTGMIQFPGMPTPPSPTAAPKKRPVQLK